MYMQLADLAKGLQIWQKDIPFKMSFLTWRAIHNKLSTIQRVARIKVTLVMYLPCELVREFLFNTNVSEITGASRLECQVK
ncbi:hypothetical protein RND71_034170 [Anisodus tanguticus]|uniref:Reverse transcriptase zinc-binding domain-containing protein n=1 Tax=Anisodus tanguticus TaxID=243964 RepID=A0AAE1V2A4_9SOLA|nr:hypothetical protein RND71_034170 [Anisodus tanguticus]